MSLHKKKELASAMLSFDAVTKIQDINGFFDFLVYRRIVKNINICKVEGKTKWTIQKF